MKSTLSRRSFVSTSAMAAALCAASGARSALAQLSEAGGAPSPKIEWLSDAALQISYAKPSAAKPLKLKDADVTKAVHVTFVER